MRARRMDVSRLLLSGYAPEGKLRHKNDGPAYAGPAEYDSPKIR